jgi:hypothetical protein
MKKYFRFCDKCKKKINEFIKISYIKLLLYKTIKTKNLDICFTCFNKVKKKHLNTRIYHIIL